MFYEGTEKRLFICVKAFNLLTFPDCFWKQLVARSGADILSSISTPSVKAYLLSESSLFVWEDKLLLITCGNTQLVKAALFIQQHISKQHITTLIFQRHQALKPHLQSTSFQQDTLLLEKQFHGQKRHWGGDYQGDLFIFGETPQDSMPTQCIYMFHGLNGTFSQQLQDGHINKQMILETLKLTHYFDDLLIDHFSFNPRGYSLNAVRGKDYLAIHITPEQLSTYLSIESSFKQTLCVDFIQHLQQLLQPKKFKQMTFKNLNQQLAVDIC